MPRRRHHPAATNPSSSGSLTYQAEDNTIRPVFEGAPYNRNVGMIYSATNSAQAAGFITNCFLDPASLNNGVFKCRFTTKNNFTGSAVFKYLASNGSFGSEVVTVTIDVTSSNSLSNKVYTMGYHHLYAGFLKNSSNMEQRTLVVDFHQPDVGLNIPISTGVLSGLKTFVSNSDNSAACGIRDNGTALCSSPHSDNLVGIRGNNFVNQNGVQNSSRWMPLSDETGKANQTGISDLQISAFQSCAIVGVEKRVMCWQPNYSYSISASTPIYTGCGFHATITSNGIPCPVVEINESPLENVQKIALARYNGCAIVSDNGQGKLYCWGYRIDGNNGVAAPKAYDYTTMRNHAVLVSGLENDSVIDVKLGDYFGCAILSDNSMKCWGENDSGQLGNGATNNSLVYPAQSVTLPSAPKPNSLYIQDKLACYIGVDNNLYCWGQNHYTFSDNQSKSIPTLVAGLVPNAVKIKMRQGTYCALNTSKNLYCWGYNYYGQVGTTTNKETSTPISISNAVLVKKADNATNFSVRDFYVGSNQVIFIED